MDLTTRYLGLTLRSPVLAGASPLTGHLGNIRRLEDLGAGAVVLPSIFEEQIEQELDQFDRLTARTDSFAEATTYFPSHIVYGVGPEHYIETVGRAAEAVDIPVIASLNGTTNHGWIGYARQLQQAGAAALELNLYFVAADPNLASHEVERRYLSILKAVKKAVTIPVAMKLSPYFSSVGHMGIQLEEAGADGLVLFNRFYEPDIDLAQLKLVHTLELSAPGEMRVPLLWIGVLHGRLRLSLAASTGVDSADDVVKYLLAGADVVMTTSSLLLHGVGHLGTLVEGVQRWMSARDLHTLDAIRGKLSQRNVADPTAFERANYIRVLQGYRPATQPTHGS